MKQASPTRQTRPSARRAHDAKHGAASSSVLSPFPSPFILREAPCPFRGCKKTGLEVFHGIPAPSGIQCFHWTTNTLGPGFHRGEECSATLPTFPVRTRHVPAETLFYYGWF